jgi:hypothetical protein
MVDEILRGGDGTPVEGGDPARERVDEGVQFGVWKCPVDVSVSLPVSPRRNRSRRERSFFSCSDKSRDAGFCWRRFHFALLWFHPISFSIELDNSTFRALWRVVFCRILLLLLFFAQK